MRTRRQFSREYKLSVLQAILSGDKTLMQFRGSWRSAEACCSDGSRNTWPARATPFPDPAISLPLMPRRPACCASSGTLRQENEILKKRWLSSVRDQREVRYDPATRQGLPGDQSVRRLAGLAERLLHLAEGFIGSAQRRGAEIADPDDLQKPIYGVMEAHGCMPSFRQTASVCSRKRVAKLMREEGLRALPLKRYTVTTQSIEGRPAAPNLLARDFRPGGAPRWVADITYVSTGEGNLYLAASAEPGEQGGNRIQHGSRYDGAADPRRATDGNRAGP